MNLNLKNPIIFFDLETTGIDVVNDRIVEISYLKIHPNGKEEIKTHLINPTIAIDPRSTEIHGITDEKVKDAPTFASLAKSFVREFEGCDFGGYNLNKFDIPMLVEEFLRAEVDFDPKKRRVIDVQVIFHKMEQRTLAAAYKFYCDKELEGAHSAEVDTLATYEVLKAQLDRYQNSKFLDNKGKETMPIVNDVELLSEFSSYNRNVDYVGRIILDENDNEVFNFGKHKGKKVTEVFEKDQAYYGWMMNGNFPLYTKKVITSIKLRNFNKK